MADELVALGSALLVAGLLAAAGRRVGLPTIPLFMIAGLVFGPNTPGIALVDDPHDLELLATVGLIFLLFHLGLEFSLGDLIAGGRKLLVIGSICLAINLGAALVFGLLLGWGGREALVLAGAIGVSSSAIVTKLLVELKRLAAPESRLILGLVVVEDIFFALYLAVLQPVINRSGGAGEVANDLVVAFAFIAACVALARWGAPVVGRLIASADDELLTVCFVGLTILAAGLADEVGVSDAIGAFLVGMILAETAVASRIEHLVLPFRDVFASIFFFAFGLSIDPGDAGSVAVPVAFAVVLTVMVNALTGTVAARMSGFGRRRAANIAFTRLGRGELSLVLATLAVAAGLDDRISPFVALYVLVLAIVGPILAARTKSLARLLPARAFPSEVSRR